MKRNHQLVKPSTCRMCGQTVSKHAKKMNETSGNTATIAQNTATITALAATIAEHWLREVLKLNSRHSINSQQRQCQPQTTPGMRHSICMIQNSQSDTISTPDCLRELMLLLPVAQHRSRNTWNDGGGHPASFGQE